LDKKISIITPSLNQGLYLEQTINSVLSQENIDIEHIIIDGKSSDNSIDIIKKYEQNLNHWESKKDNGQSHAINKGIRLAKGGIINWLNADDYYTPNALKTVYESFKVSNANCISGKSRLFNDTGTVKYSNGTDIFFNNIFKTIGWARTDQPETFFSKDAWNRVGLLNESLHYTMDREWWMRYLYYFGLSGIYQINTVLVNFRLHNDSKTIKFSSKFEEEHNTLFYLLAIAAKNHNIQSILGEYSKINMSIQSDLEKWSNQELIQKSLNYFLLKKADEAYYNDLFEAAKIFLKNVKIKWLHKEDLKLYYALIIKTRLPLSVVHFFRK